VAGRFATITRPPEDGALAGTGARPYRAGSSAPRALSTRCHLIWCTLALGLSAPQALGRDLSPLSEGLQLHPRDFREHSAEASERPEPAIGTRDDVLLADHSGEPLDALGYEFRVLDDVVLGVVL
jgi:hypothetical protein